MNYIFLTFVIMAFVGCVAVFAQRAQYTKWYNEHCDCTCGKCACHRPLEECK